MRVSVELSFHVCRHVRGLRQVKDEEWCFHPARGDFIKIMLSVANSKLNLPDFAFDKEHTKPITALFSLLSYS